MDWIRCFYPQGVKPEDVAKLEAIREAYGIVATELQKNLPEGRYKSLVLTKLEESAMFATKSLTHG